MSQGAELFKQLFDSIASPPAQALHEHVVAGNKAKALAILRGEGVRKDNAAVLYEYCRTKWLGESVDLVEVPLAVAAAAIRECEARARAAGATDPAYVVRYGLEIKSVSVYKLSEEIDLFVPGHGPVPLAKMHQFWLMKPKATETSPSSL